MSRDLLFVALALFTWGLGESAFLSFQPLYLQELGANPMSIGAILSAYGLATALAHIPAGHLADRIGRKPLMTGAWVLGILATLVMAFAASLPVLVIGILLYGLTMFVLAPLYSYVTAARGRWSVARALTITSASYHLGAIFGPSMGGLVGEQFSFRTIYVIAAGIFTLSTVFMLAIRPQPIEAASIGVDRKGVGRNTALILFLLVYFFAIFAMYLPQPLSPNFLQDQRGLSLTQIGLLYSVLGLGNVVMNLVLGQMGARPGFLLGQTLVITFPLLLWLGAGLPWYIVAYFLLGGFRAARSLASAETRTLVSSSKMGLTYGLTETVSGIATILAPLLAGVLYNLNPELVYTFSAVLIGAGVLISAGMFLKHPAVRLEIGD
jgi:MFS family permease